LSDGFDSAGRSRLSAIDVDMSDMPDMSPILGAAAAFERGATIIRDEGCVGKSFPGFWEVFEGAFQG